jgi:hypothetical protein
LLQHSQDSNMARCDRNTMDGASAGDGRTRKTYAARLLLVLCSLAACVCPLTAFAQAAQQTPESAQRFLANTLPRLYGNRSNYSGSTEQMERTSEITTSGACGMRWSAKEPAESELTLSGGVGWYEVREVRQSQTLVYVVAKNVTYIFDFRAENLASRATFAMEFLRLHCDPVADTGF